MPVSTPTATSILASRQPQLQTNPIIKKLQEDIKALASKFQMSRSVNQKETKKLQQTITLLEEKHSAVDKALESVSLTERKILKHTKLSHENSKRLYMI